MGIFKAGTMIPEGWTADEWREELKRVYLGGREPSEKGRAAGVEQLLFDKVKKMRDK